MHKVISLYSGAGGLDLGLEAAGLNVGVAVEINPWACRTLRANMSVDRQFQVIEDDIHAVPTSEIMAKAGLKVGEAALLVGGPPCQPFSKSAYWVHGDTKRLDDPRADTLSAYLRVLRDSQPKAFLLENVFGMTYKGKDEALRLLKQMIDRINAELRTKYSFHWSVLNCADYGVPQIRERFFLVGAREGDEFAFPKPTHFDPDPDSIKRKRGKTDQKSPANQLALFDSAGEDGTIEPWRTAWDAIGDLNDIRHKNLAVGGQWGDLLPSIPEGLNYLHHTNRGYGMPLFGWRRRFWSFLLKLAKNRPSWTIQAQPGSAVGPFHWKSRRLSVEEMLRIQTFPAGYKIEGGRTQAQRQLGNAVPSLMAEILGRAIRQQVLGELRLSAPLKLLPPRRRPISPPEALQEVPKKYHSLVGTHSPHPGTGKGRGVRA